MDTMSWHDLFGPVTGKLNPRRRLGSEFAEWRTLDKDTFFNGYEYAAGSQFKVFESQDAGWVVFKRDSVTPNGNTPGRFIHRN
jgi:hypothetical protein